MTGMLNLKIKRHKHKGEIYFVATSDELQGLVAEGNSIEEVVEIAKDVALAIIEAKTKKEAKKIFHSIPASFSYPIFLEA